MSRKKLNWGAYWKIVSEHNWSPLKPGYPPIKLEQMRNWFDCQEEMRWRFTSEADYMYE